MTQRKKHSWNEWDYENRRTPVWVMMLTSAFVSFVSRLDACLDAVRVRLPLDRAASVIGSLAIQGTTFSSLYHFQAPND
jgi:hypothetical protein